MAELKNDKHERFCNEFIIDLNQTKAYQRVYPDSSYTAAAASATDLLKNPNIQARITELKIERGKNNKIDAEAVLNSLKQYAEADITEFMELTPDEVKTLPIEIRRMITGFKVNERTYYDPNGQPITEKKMELSFFSKKDALEMINRHIGFYEKDNTQQRAFNVIVSSQDEAKKLSEI